MKPITKSMNSERLPDTILVNQSNFLFILMAVWNFNAEYATNKIAPFASMHWKRKFIGLLKIFPAIKNMASAAKTECEPLNKKKENLPIVEQLQIWSKRTVSTAKHPLEQNGTSSTARYCS